MAEAHRVRYAVVGVGWIAQEAILPAFGNAKNSRLAALVTGDPEKASELGRWYGAMTTVAYDGYENLLRSGDIDAVYITLPNGMHKDFSVAAARAGIHVLCEKPMAANVAECDEMIRAAEEGGAKLMIAYRLHFEPANLKAISIVASARIGEPRIFNSVFSQQVRARNVRLRKDLAGGPLMDMGVYPINAARYMFRDEPIEVSAFGGTTAEARFEQVHEAASVMLRFPGDRLASFTCSFGAAPADRWSVVGTEGWVHLEPGFDYHRELKLRAFIGGKESHENFPKHDQFGPEIAYFSECILSNRAPEPSGKEGLADIRVIQAALESIRTGRPVHLEPFHVDSRPGLHLRQEMKPVEPARIVHALSPTVGHH